MPKWQAASHFTVSGSYLGDKTTSDANDGFAKSQDVNCMDDTDTQVAHPIYRAMGTVCCDSDGVGTRPGCKKGSFEVAKKHCESEGQTLCTLEQLKGGAGEASGCGFDRNMVWSSTLCSTQAR